MTSHQNSGLFLQSFILTKIYKLNNDTDKTVKILTNLKSNIKIDNVDKKYLNIDPKKDYNKVAENISDSMLENERSDLNNFKKFETKINDVTRLKVTLNNFYLLKVS